ncbi:MAG: aspartate racemase [Elusimicrobia bacterium RIFOXYA2_FULL_40_6]|nr:MAG: aspartate racemase [Elusimicrobia bacterium RIFOXYA2_FULL_40_6]
MKTIGLIGGMSWRSTVDYYKFINEYVGYKLGKSHSAKIVMYSVDFEDIEQLQHKGEWGLLTDMMVNAAKTLEKAGAEFVLICTNTMHKLAGEVESAISIPLLHIADATAEEIKLKGIKKVGLLGTKYTMEQDFYKNKLMAHGLEVVIPDLAGRETMHQVIYREIIPDKIRKESLQNCNDIINKLADNGAEGIILGCTELPLLIKQEDLTIPLFDTTKIHSLAAAKLALLEKEAGKK